MNEIEKEIEEMAKEIDGTFSYAKKWYPDKYEPFELNVYPDDTARHLVEQGYRNCKDKVVIPEKITEETSPEDIIKIVKYNEKIRKETAREILQALKNMAYQSNDWSHGVHPMVVEVDSIEEIAEQYGVEVE